MIAYYAVEIRGGDPEDVVAEGELFEDLVAEEVEYLVEWAVNRLGVKPRGFCLPAV